jgi:hypothetical protein
MTPAQAGAAINAGIARVLRHAQQGTNVIGFGEMGIANTSAAACVMSRLTGLPLEACIGRGTGLDDAGVARKRDILARAGAACGRHRSARRAGHVRRLRDRRDDRRLLAAAASRMVILVDGFIASAALLVAARIDPNVLQYCVFSHCSHEQGHRALLAEFGRAAAGAGPAPGRGHRRRAGVAAGGFGRGVPARDGHVQRRGRQQRVGDLKRPEAPWPTNSASFSLPSATSRACRCRAAGELGGVRAALPERRARYFPLVGLLVGASARW